MGTNSKNPYELRTEVLHMAMHILETQNRTLRENQCIKPKGTQEPVEPYSMAQILDTAEELNKFISKG